MRSVRLNLSYQKIGFKAPSFYDGFPKTCAIITSTIKEFDCSRHRAWGDFKRTGSDSKTTSVASCDEPSRIPVRSTAGSMSNPIFTE